MTDLQLDVKGCHDVYASFDKYVEVEHLDGDNKYHAEHHGLQVVQLTVYDKCHAYFSCFDFIYPLIKCTAIGSISGHALLVIIQFSSLLLCSFMIIFSQNM